MWQPINQNDLLIMIDTAEWSMGPELKVSPHRWQLPPIGDLGGGFWVVAIIGQKCIYYNDIEDGFNMSEFEEIDRIGEYLSNQSDLLPFIHSYYQHFMKEITSAT